MAFSKRPLLAALMALVLLLGGCGSNGLPAQQGSYDLQAKSITYDGQDYAFYWVDKDKSVHRARLSDIKMVQDERTYLDIQEGGPILHLATDEPVTVRAQDRYGSFGTFWFPFMLGQAMGRSGPVINQPSPGTPQTTTNVPTYRYPPSDTFGRDEELRGSLSNSKPSAPDYSKVKPAPDAVSGQSGGTGTGTGVTGKSNVSGGQASGSGSGTAASQKGGFATGKSSFSSKLGSSPAPKVGGGSGRSSVGSSRSGGGFSGGRSSGGARGGGK